MLRSMLVLVGTLLLLGSSAALTSPGHFPVKPWPQLARLIGIAEPKAVISDATGATSTAIAAISVVIAGTFVLTGIPARAGGNFVTIGVSWDAITVSCMATAASCVGIIGSFGMDTEDPVAIIADPTA